MLFTWQRVWLLSPSSSEEPMEHPILVPEQRSWSPREMTYEPSDTWSFRLALLRFLVGLRERLDRGR